MRLDLDEVLSGFRSEAGAAPAAAHVDGYTRRGTGSNLLVIRLPAPAFAGRIDAR
jgi:hypothetical protein